LALALTAANLSAVGYTVAVDGFYTGEADAEPEGTSLDGDLKTWQVGADMEIEAGNYREGMLVGNFGYALRRYEAGVDLVDDTFEEDFDMLSVGLRYQTQLQGQWGLTTFAGATFGQGEDGDLGEGGTYAVAALADYNFNQALTVSFGLAYFTQLGDDDQVIPLVAVRWQINERWMLRTYDGVYLNYDLSGDGRQTMDAFVSWQNDSYSIGSVNGDEIYLNDEGFVAGVRYTYTLPGGLKLSPYLGYWFGRQVEERDEHDHTLSEVDVDPTWIVGGNISMEF